MKSNYKYLTNITLLCSLILFIGCNEFLSEIPDNRSQIDSPDKISQLITGAYSTANYQLMASIMSDNSEIKVEGIGDRMQKTLYNWEDATTFETDRDSPTYFWNNTYAAISQANAALEAISKLEGKYDLKSQKGEALIARAYGHFMIANFWCKQYNPKSAKTDLGIPYVLKPEKNLIQNYDRGTLAEVYELIEKDLEEGLAIVGNDYVAPKFHFTELSASAFAARFYLYKGDWDKVIKYSSKAVTNPEKQLRNMVAYKALSYDGNRLLYPSVKEESNLLIASTASLWARRFAGTNFGLSINKANQLFFGSPGNPFKKSWAYTVYGGTDLVYNFPKFREYFKITNQNAGIGSPYTGIVLFDRDETILNRAEAYVMKENYASALKDLNIFLSKKTLSYNATTDILTEDMVVAQYPVVPKEYTPFYTLNDKQTSFVKFIAELKRRESYHQGLRWFDVKRFDLEVSRKLSILGDPNVLVKGDKRRLLKIPKNALNFGIVDNPR
ncbi:RagB/SusD family nutrient uptake outer membrane protein [Polaribacter cellanae]|uniref:RagB/SusD family nutrient uptake outer membrane protein n=1 Tax=Polaribacter cellanae TaxID=2818493 RepID=A0A975H838_9FLAO|nr:RagB/SusD family nutrient uptake outer membrane protein [Polaribacter cellanae]QTE24107.1 RagB/SusD family nutrient uptake outer membrane protein [Polaribacter cellanae]